ncbi:zinc finger BED domain-containing protein RICESLEEPER 2 [Spinacia oleracea]|uniref:Zinc finger BED domain-containing protein RICESLEEPER 2 n=1 Tax=Spinacia oleracea TaxID=3562 RepID=A0ABM3R1J8_SPIOL|nr:zinc finger BED domain-containing protein RICESLEEPER 2-like [Spinacia oleracea]
MMMDKLVSLFDEYQAESSLMKANDEARNAAMSNNQQSESDSLMMDFDNFSTKMPTKALKSELESYLEEQLMPRSTDLNVLEFWRTHEARYPTLARMARDILAIPISIVASESAFSTGGRVLDAYRSSLLPSVVEAIICLRDWVFGQVKMEPQLEELCGAIMKMKVEEQVDAVVNVDDPSSPIVASPGTQDSNKV